MSGVGAALTIAAAEIRRFARDRTALVFVLVLPVVVIVVIGTAFGAAPSSAPVGLVVADDRTGATVEAFESADTVELRRYESRSRLDVGIRTGVVVAGVVIGDEAVTVVLDRTDASAGTVRSTISGILGRIGTVGAAADALDVGVEELAPVTERVPTTVIERVAVDGGLGGAANNFAYTAPSQLVLVVFLNSLVTGGTLVGLRRDGVTRRWAAAPVPTRALVAGVLLGRGSFALLQAVIILVVGAFAFGVDWGHPVGVAAVVVTFAAVAAGVGVIVGALSRSEEKVAAVGVPAAIALGMLGGCMWPLEIVSDPMRVAGHLAPHAWAVDAFVVLVFDGGSPLDVLVELAVLGVFAVVVLGAAVVTLRRRLL